LGKEKGMVLHKDSEAKKDGRKGIRIVRMEDIKTDLKGLLERKHRTGKKTD